MQRMDNNSMHDIVEKPWGWYSTTFTGNKFKTKILTIYPLKRISLQSHARRKELWSIVSGSGICTLDDSLIEVSENSHVVVPVSSKHRIHNTSTKDDLVICEVLIGDYLEEDDIVRYDDDYGRVN